MNSNHIQLCQVHGRLTHQLCMGVTSPVITVSLLLKGKLVALRGLTVFAVMAIKLSHDVTPQ